MQVLKACQGGAEGGLGRPGNLLGHKAQLFTGQKEPDPLHSPSPSLFVPLAKTVSSSVSRGSGLWSPVPVPEAGPRMGDSGRSEEKFSG